MRSRSLFLIQNLREIKKCIVTAAGTNGYSGCLHRYPIIACVEGRKGVSVRYNFALSSASADFLCKIRYL